MTVRESLSELGVFHEIDPDTLDRIVECSRLEHCPANYTVFKEGDLLTHLYVVEQGVVRTTTDVWLWPGQNPVKTAIKTIQAGEVFGWAAVLDPPRTGMSAHAISNTTLIVIDGAKLRQIMNKRDSLRYNIMEELFKSEVERVHVTNHAIAMAAVI